MFTRSGLDLSELWDKYSHLCEMDDDLRNLERASRAGDPDARNRYIAALNRVGRHDAALRHVIDQHRDHMMAWRGALNNDADAAKHHGAKLWSARTAAHEHAERYGLHLADHMSRHPEESPEQFLGRAVHLHEPHGTTFHPLTDRSTATVRFDAEHGRTREEVLNKQRPRPRPHAATGAAFANMWRRETGGQASAHESSGMFGDGTIVTVHRPSEGSTSRP